jgi:hypothetical protein
MVLDIQITGKSVLRGGEADSVFAWMVVMRGS